MPGSPRGRGAGGRLLSPRPDGRRGEGKVGGGKPRLPPAPRQGRWDTRRAQEGLGMSRCGSGGTVGGSRALDVALMGRFLRGGREGAGHPPARPSFCGFVRVGAEYRGRGARGMGKRAPVISAPGSPPALSRHGSAALRPALSPRGQHLRPPFPRTGIWGVPLPPHAPDFLWQRGASPHRSLPRQNAGKKIRLGCFQKVKQINFASRT